MPLVQREPLGLRGRLVQMVQMAQLVLRERMARMEQMVPQALLDPQVRRDQLERQVLLVPPGDWRRRCRGSNWWRTGEFGKDRRHGLQH